MDWGSKVALFENIRREYEFGAGTIAGVARKLGVRRRMVRKAIHSALLRAILQRISTHPQNSLDDLLPDKWKLARPSPVC